MFPIWLYLLESRPIFCLFLTHPVFCWPQHPLVCFLLFGWFVVSCFLLLPYLDLWLNKIDSEPFLGWIETDFKTILKRIETSFKKCENHQLDGVSDAVGPRIFYCRRALLQSVACDSNAHWRGENVTASGRRTETRWSNNLDF